MAIEVAMPVYQRPECGLPSMKEPALALVYGGLKPLMTAALSRMVLCGKRRGDAAAQVLDQVFANQLPAAFRRVIEAERRPKFMDAANPDPMQQLLESSGIAKERMTDLSTLRQIALPQATEKSLRSLFSGRSELIAHLSSLENLPSRGRPGQIFGLVKEIADHFRSSPQDALLKVYKLVEQTLGQPAFTVPHDRSEALYFLTHLPRIVRYAVQGALIANNSADFLDQAVPETAAGELVAAREAVKRYLRLSAFASSHWNSLLLSCRAPEKLVLQIGKTAHEVERELVNLAALPGSARVLELEHDHSDFRRNAAFEVSRRFEGSHLQHIDTGHCFPNWDPGLGSVADRRRHSQYVRKDGRLAVVFEDDPLQSAAYRKIVNLSSLSCPEDGSLCTSSPERVLQIVQEKPAVALYLLDIAQPNNQYAGLDLTNRLLKELCSVLPPLPRGSSGIKDSEFIGDRPKRVKVILWSASPDLVNLAEATLSDLVKSNPALKANVNMHGSGGRERIELEVRLKSDAWFVRFL